MSGYLVALQVPVFTDGDRTLVGSEWKRALLLLRDSLAPRYAPLTVMGPRLSVAQRREQVLEELSERHDGIRLVPSIDWSRRARDYWLADRAQWGRDLAAILPTVDVVHAGLADLYRPVAYQAFKAGVRAGKATIFVQDTDIIVQISQLAKGRPLHERLKAKAYLSIYERVHRAGVANASLALLKGHLLEHRYARFAKRCHIFENTSYVSSEIVPPAQIAPRLASLTAVTPAGRRPVRLVYCGRFIPRKGLLDSLRILHAARQRGADATLELIGEGPQRDELERLRDELGLQSVVTLPGRAPYGQELINRLSTFDALFFTPLAEDTPRMIFDGYAAGLPLIGSAIDYVRERSEDDATVAMMPLGDNAAAADVLVRLCANRDELVTLARRAMDRAVYHAADGWYARRADWTFEAIEAHYRRANALAGVKESVTS